MKELFIKDVLHNQFIIGQTVELYGWVASVRVHKSHLFFDLEDSTGRIQVIVNTNIINVRIKPEQSIMVLGSLMLNSKSKKYEIVAKSVQIIGDVTLPLSPAPRSDFDIFDNRYTNYVQQNRHLFIRNSKVCAVLKARDYVKTAVCNWFKEKNFTEITAPILTGVLLYDNSTGIPVRVNNQDLFLTQCVAFYLESAVHAFERVYNIGPSFRGAESVSPRHLTEYWHVKAEIAFCPFEDMFSMVESLINSIVEEVMPLSHEIYKALEIKPIIKNIQKIPYPRISYCDAIKLCKSQGIDVAFGKSLGDRAEAFLTEYFDSPLWVTHNARSIEGFPYKICEFDDRLTYTADLIGNCGGGEILGIADKITDYNELSERLAEKGKSNETGYEWFKELRNYGTVPHCGIGMGLERLIKWIYKLSHVREAIPFPRSIGRKIYP